MVCRKSGASGQWNLEAILHGLAWMLHTLGTAATFLSGVITFVIFDHIWPCMSSVAQAIICFCGRMGEECT